MFPTFREPDDFNGAFEAMDHDKPGAILMVSDALMILNRKRIFDFAAARRLPAIMRPTITLAMAA